MKFFCSRCKKFFEHEKEEKQASEGNQNPPACPHCGDALRVDPVFNFGITNTPVMIWPDDPEIPEDEEKKDEDD